VKALLRSGPVQSLLALLLGGYLWLVLRTIRWRMLNRPAADALTADPQGFLVCLWHAQIAAAVGGQPLVRPLRPTRLIISLSPDGEFIARAMEMMDLASFRGSSRKTRDPKRRHSGGAVYRQSLSWVREGGVLILTPDGPRGPAREMAEGPVRMASRTGAPVILMGLCARPALTLDTWDRMELPLPFGRGAIVFDGPVRAPADADAEETLRLRREWSDRLSRATDAAKAELAPVLRSSRGSVGE
jgi:lysophospholipid acyltransferase (LPLAT)-like uncharacterized protein